MQMIHEMSKLIHHLAQAYLPLIFPRLIQYTAHHLWAIFRAYNTLSEDRLKLQSLFHVMQIVFFRKP